MVAAVSAMAEGNAEAEEARRLAAGGACAALCEIPTEGRRAE